MNSLSQETIPLTNAAQDLLARPRDALLLFFKQNAPNGISALWTKDELAMATGLDAGDSNLIALYTDQSNTSGFALADSPHEVKGIAASITLFCLSLGLGIVLAAILFATGAISIGSAHFATFATSAGITGAALIAIAGLIAGFS